MTQSRLFVGIDPGAHGAVALLDVYHDGDASLDVFDLPVRKVTGSSRVFTLVDGPRLIAKLHGRAIHAVWLERVHTMPGEGAVGAFSFGENFGTIKGVLAGLGLEPELVEPSVWKAAMQAPANKQESKARAIKLFPQCARLFSRADKAEASMIALYGALRSGARIGTRIRAFGGAEVAA